MYLPRLACSGYSQRHSPGEQPNAASFNSTVAYLFNLAFPSVHMNYFTTLLNEHFKYFSWHIINFSRVEGMETDNVDNIFSLIRLCWLPSARACGQWNPSRNPPVLNGRCRLMQVVLNSGCNTVVVVVSLYTYVCVCKTGEVRGLRRCRWFAAAARRTWSRSTRRTSRSASR